MSTSDDFYVFVEWYHGGRCVDPHWNAWSYHNLSWLNKRGKQAHFVQTPLMSFNNNNMYVNRYDQVHV